VSGYEQQTKPIERSTYIHSSFFKKIHTKWYTTIAHLHQKSRDKVQQGMGLEIIYSMLKVNGSMPPIHVPNKKIIPLSWVVHTDCQENANLKGKAKTFSNRLGQNYYWTFLQVSKEYGAKNLIYFPLKNAYCES